MKVIATRLPVLCAHTKTRGYNSSQAYCSSRGLCASAPSADLYVLKSPNYYCSFVRTILYLRAMSPAPSSLLKLNNDPCSGTAGPIPPIFLDNERKMNPYPRRESFPTRE
jgi:hypothetical protein